MPHPAFGRRYQQRLAGLRSGPPVACAHCRRARATTLDHWPPLAEHEHRPGAGCCRLIPSCVECNREGGRRVGMGVWRPDVPLAKPDETEMALREHQGLSESDSRWDVAWMSDLRPVPADGRWPRLMTVPHPDAVGSLGDEFVAWAQGRTGGELRWWQRLAVVRLLEVDRHGRLVWPAALISTARQVGKSWLLRELLFWRIHQAERFGEPQDVLHTGKDIAVTKEVQRAARIWCKARPGDYRVREVNGQEEIEHLASGSRWMLRAREATYGYSVSLGAVDEAWKVKAATVDEGLTPTMAEREQAQLVLVSTAHRLATSLMLDRRLVALGELETGAGDLLVEWSAPRAAKTGDMDAWKQASPHWTPRRQQMIEGAHTRMLAGETVPDSDEPDPVESFRSQWLNQWPLRGVDEDGPTVPLLPTGVWRELRSNGTATASGPVWVGLEDDYGVGAAVGCCRRCDDGRYELDGWTRPDWDSAVADLVAMAPAFRVRRVLVGASILDRLPPELRKIAEPRSAAATRQGLALLRDLAQTGQVVHDVVTGELDEAFDDARVREMDTGLLLIARGQTHLVKAVVWALAAAHRPAVMPAIH